MNNDEMQNREQFHALAHDLEMQDAVKYAEVITNLRDLEYDDFANEKFAAPKMQMIKDFTELGRQDIVDRVKNGDFDQ
jgi:hypothetical protein